MIPRRVIDYVKDIAEYVTNKGTDRSVQAIVGEVLIYTGYAVCTDW